MNSPFSISLTFPSFPHTPTYPPILPYKRPSLSFICTLPTFPWTQTDTNPFATRTNQHGRYRSARRAGEARSRDEELEGEVVHSHSNEAGLLPVRAVIVGGSRGKTESVVYVESVDLCVCVDFAEERDELGGSFCGSGHDDVPGSAVRVQGGEWLGTCVHQC